MKEITVKSQAELDALPKQFSEYTIIYLQDSQFHLNEARGNCHVEARGNCHVEAWENCHVAARGNCHVEAWGNCHVVARENCHVVAGENCHVEARGNCHVEARGNCHVEAWENCHVEAWGNCHVVAWGNCHVVARENCHVEARGNCHVEARGNCHVEAWENCHVAARGSSRVDLLMLAICIVYSANAVVKAVSKLATIVKPKVLPKMTVSIWCQANGIKQSGKSVTLFKRVSKDYKTQERTSNETVWIIGSKIEHHDYNPKIKECGEHKFHACATPYLCDEFRSGKGDRYIAIRIKVVDLYAWPTPEYPGKIAFRAGTVLYECDRYGKKI